MLQREGAPSTFKAAFQLDVTNEVLSEIRDRLVTLRAGLSLSQDESEQRQFVESTLKSIRRVVDMTDFRGPVQWPDVPPREYDPDAVLSPLAQTLAKALEPNLAEPPEVGMANDEEDESGGGSRDGWMGGEGDRRGRDGPRPDE
ncbi:MAG: hypothetical protein HC923_10670 [Myxococcales bacterium]|nr:hypothetical protein [Myxococcales bacterium]